MVHRNNLFYLYLDRSGSPVRYRQVLYEHGLSPHGLNDLICLDVGCYWGDDYFPPSPTPSRLADVPGRIRGSAGYAGLWLCGL